MGRAGTSKGGIYLEPEELARQILEETPGAIEVFGSKQDLIEYIRKAMASDYRFISDTP